MSFFVLLLKFVLAETATNEISSKTRREKSSKTLAPGKWQPYDRRVEKRAEIQAQTRWLRQ